MCMANQLGNYAPTMALVTIVGALRHSMPMITVLNKWIAIFSLIHVFSYDRYVQKLAQAPHQFLISLRPSSQIK